MTDNIIWEDQHELPVVRTEVSRYTKRYDLDHPETFGLIHLTDFLGEWDVAMSLKEALAVSEQITNAVSDIVGEEVEK